MSEAEWSPIKDPGRVMPPDEETGKVPRSCQLYVFPGICGAPCVARGRFRIAGYWADLYECPKGHKHARRQLGSGRELAIVVPSAKPTWDRPPI
jgi:hypothetical protein